MRNRRHRTGAAAGTTSPRSVSSTSAGGPALAALDTGRHGPVSTMGEVAWQGIAFLGQNCSHRDDVDRSCVKLTVNRDFG